MGQPWTNLTAVEATVICRVHFGEAVRDPISLASGVQVWTRSHGQ